MFRLDPETVWYFDHDYVWMVLGPAQAPGQTPREI